LGYFVWKITILRQKILFFSNFRGARAGCVPPLRTHSCVQHDETSWNSWHLSLLPTWLQGQEKLWDTINLSYTRVTQLSPIWNTKRINNSWLL
jgi:hypothetical protein